MENKTKQNKRKKERKGIAGQVNRLALVLGLGGLTGPISLAAIAGLFKLENAFMLSILLIAGPGAILTALMLDGTAKERILVALISGILATIIVILAAGIGTTLLSFLNINVLKISGGIAILLIGLIIMGIKIPDKIPLVIVGLGIITSLIWRFV